MQTVLLRIVRRAPLHAFLCYAIACSKGPEAPAPEWTRLLDAPDQLAVTSNFTVPTTLEHHLAGATMLADGPLDKLVSERGGSLGGANEPSSWIDSLLVATGSLPGLDAAQLQIVALDTTTLDAHWLVLEAKRELGPGELVFVISLDGIIGLKRLQDPAAVEILLRSSADSLRRLVSEPRFGLDHAFATTIDPKKAGATTLLGVVTRVKPLAGARVRLARLDEKQRWLLSPSDAGESAAIRTTTIGNTTRRSILLGTEARIARDITIPKQAPVFRCAIAIPWKDPPAACSVEMRFDRASGAEEVFRESIVAGGKTWTTVEKDLSAIAGERGRFEISISARDVPNSALVLLAEPMVEGSVPNVPMDVMIVSIDTARYDRFSLYGNSRATTPNLDRLAASSSVFGTAVAAAPWTLPSHVSIFSAQVPDRHGVHGSQGRVPRTTPWLPAALHDAGYRTIAFTAGGWLDPSFGFGRGFENYSVRDPAFPNIDWANATRSAKSIRQAEQSVAEKDELLRQLGEPRRRPIAVFVHTFLVHNYAAPPTYLKEFGAKDDEVAELLKFDTQGFNPHAISGKQIDDAKLVYDATLRAADAFIGEIVSRLEKENLLDRVILVVLADHGEELGDHGAFGHRHTVYDELIRVPLLIRVPGKPARRIMDPVALIDVAPTILDLLGIANPAFDAKSIDGRSLVPLIDGGTREPLPVLSRGSFGESVFRSLRGERLKLIETVTQKTGVNHELYNVASDPGELTNIAKDRADTVEKLGASLSETVANALARATGADESTIPGELEDRLRELGYLGGKKK